MTQLQKPGLSIGFFLLLGACSSAPKQVELLDVARSEYEQLSQDPTVVEHAPELMEQAGSSLREAEARLANWEEQWRIEHTAYLARQRIETARLIAEAAETGRKIEKMSEQERDLTIRMREAELIKARREASDLKRSMAAMQAQQTDRGMVLTLGDVLFHTGGASLAPNAARNIAKLAAFMRNYPYRQALVEGHTDSLGDALYNMNLSRGRAFAVRDALVNAGIDINRIKTQGFGETIPVARNDTEAGRLANRRVEIIFSDPEQLVTEFDDN